MYSEEQWSDFLENVLLLSPKCSLFCLEIKLFRGCPSFDIEAGLRRLLDHQLHLRVLSIDFFGEHSRAQSESLNKFVESLLRKLANIVKERRPDMDLVIWSRDLVAINRKLTSHTIKKLDKMDREYNWDIRRRCQEAVSLDPSNALLFLPV